MASGRPPADHDATATVCTIVVLLCPWCCTSSYRRRHRPIDSKRQLVNALRQTWQKIDKNKMYETREDKKLCFIRWSTLTNASKLPADRHVLMPRSGEADDSRLLAILSTIPDWLVCLADCLAAEYLCMIGISASEFPPQWPLIGLLPHENGAEKVRIGPERDQLELPTSSR